MQQTHRKKSSFPGNRTIAFLKRSFVFSLLYSTMLYVIVRLFFYEFPFTLREGFELHGKILLVAWMFLVACKLAFGAIILVENNLSERTFDRAIYVPVLKRFFFILFTAALAYTGKTADSHNTGKMADSANSSNDEPAMGQDSAF